mmetsp:Transcript_14163/g.25978  ORF Transcript_14163/g.25978 Transcript_14163/m.25978 type:complete len:314 (-) Transcript_14163:2841-3782(-)
MKTNVATLGVLLHLHDGVPGDHPNLVAPDVPGSLNQVLVLVEQQLVAPEYGRRHGIGGAGDVGGGEGLQVGVPLVDQADLKEAEEVVGVGGPDAASDGPLGLDDVGGAVGVEGAHLVLCSEGAELLGDSSDDIGVLVVGGNLEPLSRHGRGDKADGLDDGLSVLDDLAAELDLDLVHAELEEPGGEAGLELVHDGHLHLRDLLGGGLNLREGVKENAAGGRLGNAGVGDGPLELVEALQEGTRGSARGGDVAGVRKGADEDDLRWTSPDAFLPTASRRTSLWFVVRRLSSSRWWKVGLMLRRRGSSSKFWHWG